jgi:hypothetical protein
MKIIFIKILVATLGLIIGCICFALSLIVAGLGEGYGWESQGYFGMLAIILTPYAFFEFAYYSKGSLVRTKVLLGLAFLLNLSLTLMTFFEWQLHPNHNFSGAPIWLVFWSIWQIAVLITYILQVRARPKS